MPEVAEKVVETPEQQAQANTDVLTKGTQPPAPKFAGKFDSEEKLSQGIAEGHKFLGLTGVEVPKDAKAAEQHYLALQTLIATRGKPTAAPAADPAPKPSTDPAPGVDAPALKIGEPEKPAAPVAETPEPKDIKEVLALANLDPASLEKQWTEKGELTAEQYAALKAKNPGLTKLVVDHIARGLVAERATERIAVNQAVNEAAAIVGGKAQFDQLLKDAATFVPADEKDDINARLNSVKHIKGAVRDLLEFRAKHIGAAGAKPLASGSTPTTNGTKISLGEFKKLSAQLKDPNPAIAAAAKQRLLAMPPEAMADWMPRL